jgi:hypothetical protein
MIVFGGYNFNNYIQNHVYVLEFDSKSPVLANFVKNKKLEAQKTFNEIKKINH